MDDLSEIKKTRRLILRSLMVLVLVLVFYESLLIRNWSFPRSPETDQAIDAYQASPTPELKATMLKQFDQDVLHNERRVQTKVGLLLFADLIAIYLLWNYGLPKVKT